MVTEEVYDGPGQRIATDVIAEDILQKTILDWNTTQLYEMTVKNRGSESFLKIKILLL